MERAFRRSSTVDPGWMSSGPQSSTDPAAPCRMARVGRWLIPLGYLSAGFLSLLSWGSPVAWGAEPGRPASPIRRLVVFPEIVRLTGPAATQHLVVIGIGVDGSSRDLTAEAKLVSESPNVVRIDGDRTIRPVVDGRGKVAVRFGSASTLVPVEIKDYSRPRRVSFGNDIVPPLTKLGCNQGACHGSQHGKGGFQALAPRVRARGRLHGDRQECRGRRVTPVRPRGELAPAQADPVRGPWRRQADGSRLARL